MHVSACYPILSYRCYPPSYFYYSIASCYPSLHPPWHTCIVSYLPIHPPSSRIESPSLSAARLRRLNIPKKPKYISLYIKTTWPDRHYRDQPTTTHAPPSTILLSTLFLSPSVSGVRSLFSSIAAHLERRLSASSRTVGVWLRLNLVSCPTDRFLPLSSSSTSTCHTLACDCDLSSCSRPTGKSSST